MRAERLEQALHRLGVGPPRGRRVVEGLPDAAQAGEVVQLVGPDVGDESSCSVGVGDVQLVDGEVVGVREGLEIRPRRARADRGMHEGALREQPLHEVEAVLASGTGDDGGRGRLRHTGRSSALERCCAYQSIVRRRPSSNDVVAAKPKRSRARLVSSARRGWPSGLVASQRISPSKPVSSAISSTSSRIVISRPTPRLTGSAPS